jgi:glycosyltransferase involved in cell wall biosynthesis
VSRVLLVGKGPPDRGGIPTFLRTLLTGPLAERHRLTFLNVAHSGVPQGGRATASNLGRTLRDFVRVWRAARGHEIVHVHSAMAPSVTVLRAGLLALGGRLRGCSVILHVHGSELEAWLHTGLRSRLLRLATSPAHRVAVCWTNGERLLVGALGAERVRLVDNGVEVPLVPAADPGAHASTRILYVGLLTPRKGVLDLLAASELLHERGVAHTLWLCGGTPDEGPEAEVPVREAAAAANAVLAGSRPPEQMHEAYEDADIFCLPSWYEAMPLSILEAAAHGLPVVASDVGDVSRAVLDGVTGFVVPVKSAPSLATALEKLLSDPDARRRMGAAGRDHVRMNFSSEATARAVDRLYDEVVGPAR